MSAALGYVLVLGLVALCGWLFYRHVQAQSGARWWTKTTCTLKFRRCDNQIVPQVPQHYKNARGFPFASSASALSVAQSAVRGLRLLDCGGRREAP